MLGAMPNPNDPAIPGTAPDAEDVYDWYYQDTYGVTSAAPGPYPRQDCAHDGHPVDMTNNPVSGDWVYPAVGSGLLIQNPHASPVTVSLPLDDVDDVEPAGSHTLTIAPGNWGLLPVPPAVYGYEPCPIIYNGIPNVAYVQFR
jgi:hypothetical protein